MLSCWLIIIGRFWNCLGVLGCHYSIIWYRENMQSKSKADHTLSVCSYIQGTFYQDILYWLTFLFGFCVFANSSSKSADRGLFLRVRCSPKFEFLSGGPCVDFLSNGYVLFHCLTRPRLVLLGNMVSVFFEAATTLLKKTASLISFMGKVVQ